ncbi:phospholipid phosphatase-related protein type 1-like [Glandiceps talaboti]
MRRKGPLVTKNNALIPCFIFIDCIVMAGVVALWYFVEFSDEFTAVKRGFTCNDDTLMKPYVKLDDHTLPKLMVYIMAFALPVVVILFGEACLAVHLLKNRKYEKQEKVVKTCGCLIQPVFRRMIRFVGVSGFGGFVTWIATDVGQLMSGRLTPYFLTVCQPNCTGIADNQFITDDSLCAGSASQIAEARMSFPSLYSSLSMYSTFFMALYIHSMLKVTGSRLLSPLLCVGIISLSYMCGLTELQQYRHHGVDILFGFLLGAVIAGYLGIVTLNNFEPNPHDSYEEGLDGVSVVTLPRPKLHYPMSNGNHTIPLDRGASRRSDQFVVTNPAFDDGPYQSGFSTSPR